MLLLLELYLGSCAYVDDRYAASKLGKPLLELLPVIIGSAVLDLELDLGNPVADSAGLACSIDDRRVLLLDLDALRPAEHGDISILKLHAELFGDDLAASEDRDILEHGLAPVAEARSLDGYHAERAPDSIEDQRRKGFAIDILCDDEERLAGLGDLLKKRQEILHGRDLLVVDEDIRIVEHRSHRIPVVADVSGKVSAVELHAFHEVDCRLDRLGLLDSDDAILADLVHSIGDLIADCPVVVCGNGSDLRNLLLILDHLGFLLDALDRILDSLVDAPLYTHWIDTRRNALHAFLGNRPSKYRCRSRSIASHVVGLGCDFLEKLGTHVLKRILELDFLSYRDSILRHRRRAVLLVEKDETSLRSKRRHDSLGDLLNTIDQ